MCAAFNPNNSTAGAHSGDALGAVIAVPDDVVYCINLHTPPIQSG
jgi:ethanolamine utilization microcompartment shell protein EutL